MSIYAHLLALSSRTAAPDDGRPGGRRPTEDVLTEVIAHLFRRDADAREGLSEALVVCWLRQIRALGGGGPVTAVRIETQRTYAALTGHPCDSRPDLVVTLDRGGTAEVVFVESKVDSGEGDGQLARYAEHLHARHAGAARRTLVYLTQNYDPKDQKDVLAQAPGVAFVQARWHDVYSLARHAKPTAPPALASLYDDTLAFLTHLHMDHEPRFTPADALALARIPRTIRFLDETLWAGSPGQDAPAERFRKLFGDPGQKNAGLARIRDRSQYFLYRRYRGTGSGLFEVILGYSFKNEGFPGLFLELGSLSENDGPEGNRKVFEQIRSLAGRPIESLGAEWKTYDSPAKRWAGAHVSVPLATILAEADHVAAARGVLLTLMDDLAAVIAESPDLPPRGAQADVEAESTDAEDTGRAVSGD